MAELQRKSAGDVVVDYIVSLISKGELKTGDRLPNERELSAQLNVSRVSLREAISSLAVAGVLERRQGAGTYVGSFDPVEMGKTAYLFSLLGGADLSQVLNTRRALEAESAWQTAQNAGKAEKAAITNALKAAEKKFGQETVLAFHLAVADGAGNTFLRQLLETVAHTGNSLWENQKAPAPDKDTTLDYMAKVEKAIVSGDSQTAYSVMYEYMAWLCQYGEL